MTKKFDTFDITKHLKQQLAKMGYETATDIQEQTIPTVLAGHDVLASSQTGTGKTAAFLIPVITQLANNKGKTALIIAPTRELAKQVWTVANQMLGSSNKTALLIGGDSMPGQIRQLKQNPKVIVGTPGRINDHLSKRKSLKLDDTEYLILDETDRMLDMGFGIQIDEILTHMTSKKRQTIMFSATLPKGIVKIADKYLTDPVRIKSGADNSVVDKIKQTIIQTEERFEALKKELAKATGSVIIFARTQRNTEKLHKSIKGLEDDHTVDYLHGGLRQNKREKVMKRFRDAKFKVLIATDVASRGLDVPHIDHVINYDLPDSPEDYVHRIGRTGRAEKTGESVSLVSKKDEHKWCAIQRFLHGEDAEPAKGNSKSKKKKKHRKSNAPKTNKKGNPGKSKRPGKETFVDKREGSKKDNSAQGGKGKGKGGFGKKSSPAKGKGNGGGKSFSKNKSDNGGWKGKPKGDGGKKTRPGKNARAKNKQSK